jgi:hypothetical protein
MQRPMKNRIGSTVCWRRCMDRMNIWPLVSSLYLHADFKIYTVHFLSAGDHVLMRNLNELRTNFGFSKVFEYCSIYAWYTNVFPRQNQPYVYRFPQRRIARQHGSACQCGKNHLSFLGEDRWTLNSYQFGIIEPLDTTDSLRHRFLRMPKVFVFDPVVIPHTCVECIALTCLFYSSFFLVSQMFA